jgi:hypothetical protein
LINQIGSNKKRSFPQKKEKKKEKKKERTGGGPNKVPPQQHMLLAILSSDSLQTGETKKMYVRARNVMFPI